jgi:hypothetical protein
VRDGLRPRQSDPESLHHAIADTRSDELLTGPLRCGGDSTTDDRPFILYPLKASQALTNFSRDFFRVLSPDVTDMGLFLLITIGLILVAVVLP